MYIIAPIIHFLGLVASMATMFNWFLAFLVTRFYSDVNDAIGAPWCYWSFGIVCAAGTAYIIMFVPETKGEHISKNKPY